MTAEQRTKQIDILKGLKKALTHPAQDIKSIASIITILIDLQLIEISVDELTLADTFLEASKVGVAK